MKFFAFTFLILFLFSSFCLNAQSSLSFDGKDDFLHVNSYSKLDLGTSDFTLEAVVSNIDFSLYDSLTIFSREKLIVGTGTIEGLRLSITNNYIILALEGAFYTVNYSVTSCKQLSVVRDNGKIFFYVNHSLVGTVPILNSVSASCSNCDLFIGKAYDANSLFKGQMDELRIWSVARTANEISKYEFTCLDKATLKNSDLVGY